MSNHGLWYGRDAVSQLANNSSLNTIMLSRLIQDWIWLYDDREALSKQVEKIMPQYERAQKAEDENAKLRADVIELRGMLGEILDNLELQLTGIEVRDLVGRMELRKYEAKLKEEMP